MDILVPRFFNTVILMGPTMLMSIVMGSYIGANLGWKRGTKRERIGVIMSLFFRSFPIYLSGIISLMLFSHLLGIFPLGGMRTIGLFGLSEFQKFIDVTHHLILPLTVATLYFLGDIVVISRTAMLELIGEEFLLFAKAKGLGERQNKKNRQKKCNYSGDHIFNGYGWFCFRRASSTGDSLFMAGDRQIDGRVGDKS